MDINALLDNLNKKSTAKKLANGGNLLIMQKGGNIQKAYNGGIEIEFDSDKAVPYKDGQLTVKDKKTGQSFLVKPKVNGAGYDLVFVSHGNGTGNTIVGPNGPIDLDEIRLKSVLNDYANNNTGRTGTNTYEVTKLALASLASRMGKAKFKKAVEGFVQANPNTVVSSDKDRLINDVRNITNPPKKLVNNDLPVVKIPHPMIQKNIPAIRTIAPNVPQLNVSTGQNPVFTENAIPDPPGRIKLPGKDQLNKFYALLKTNLGKNDKPGYNEAVRYTIDKLNQYANLALSDKDKKDEAYAALQELDKVISTLNQMVPNLKPMINEAAQSAFGDAVELPGLDLIEKGRVNDEDINGSYYNRFNYRNYDLPAKGGYYGKHEEENNAGAAEPLATSPGIFDNQNTNQGTPPPVDDMLPIDRTEVDPLTGETTYYHPNGNIKGVKDANGNVLKRFNEYGMEVPLGAQNLPATETVTQPVTVNNNQPVQLNTETTVTPVVDDLNKASAARTAQIVQSITELSTKTPELAALLGDKFTGAGMNLIEVQEALRRNLNQLDPKKREKILSEIKTVIPTDALPEFDRVVTKLNEGYQPSNAIQQPVVGDNADLVNGDPNSNDANPIIQPTVSNPPTKGLSQFNPLAKLNPFLKPTVSAQIANNGEPIQAPKINPSIIASNQQPIPQPQAPVPAPDAGTGQGPAVPIVPKQPTQGLPVLNRIAELASMMNLGQGNPNPTAPTTPTVPGTGQGVNTMPFAGATPGDKLKLLSGLAPALYNLTMGLKPYERSPEFTNPYESQAFNMSLNSRIRPNLMPFRLATANAMNDVNNNAQNSSVRNALAQNVHANMLGKEMDYVTNVANINANIDQQSANLRNQQGMVRLQGAEAAYMRTQNNKATKQGFMAQSMTDINRLINNAGDSMNKTLLNQQMMTLINQNSTEYSYDPVTGQIIFKGNRPKIDNGQPAPPAKREGGVIKHKDSVEVNYVPLKKRKFTFPRYFNI